MSAADALLEAERAAALATAAVNEAGMLLQTAEIEEAEATRAYDESGEDVHLETALRAKLRRERAARVHKSAEGRANEAEAKVDAARDSDARARLEHEKAQVQSLTARIVPLAPRFVAIYRELAALVDATAAVVLEATEAHDRASVLAEGLGLTAELQVTTPRPKLAEARAIVQAAIARAAEAEDLAPVSDWLVGAVAPHWTDDNARQASAAAIKSLEHFEDRKEHLS